MPRDVVLHGALLEGTGTQMDKPLEQIVAHIALDERGVPVWWDQPLPSDQELDLRTALIQMRPQRRIPTPRSLCHLHVHRHSTTVKPSHHKT